ncbi:protein ALWAYS EARLY 3-like isoform X1 [Cucurbita maxima]|uniref:Protein ALWAYS EARLY 3-like isoform X1 n=1 Tax=Cucurbita maxima TaxID=3661 RepID=A0A6J1IFF8_CUCMA|nr:protein ALWAYS EARLY 3-like isoform X1 [Cucurbita maxima]
MAPSRKSRSVNKRLSSANEASSSKYVEAPSKGKQKKRKFADLLGPQWSRDEVEQFYEAYRKYGKDWKKVAAAVRNRSTEMVEALFTMNRAYLSLPEGTASVVGLIAMMTDHYSVLMRFQRDSESEQESNEDSGATRKPQKRLRGKSRNNNSKGLDAHSSQSQSLPTNYGCLSLLKKRRSGIKPHAVGKRTPRVPVSYSYDKDSRERIFSPSRHTSKLKVDDPNDDDVAHEIALVLTEASQRDGSPQLSQTPNPKIEGHVLSPIRNDRMRSESDMMSTKFRCSEMDEGGCELSLGSTGADNADYDQGKNTREIQRKGKRYYGKKAEVEESMYNHLDDIKEACSGTEEGQKSGSLRGKLETEDFDVKSVRTSFKGPRKRSKKALFGDECSAFDALQTLADLSLMMPDTTADTEPSAKVKEENLDVMDKSKMKGNHSVVGAGISASKTSKTGKASGNNVGPIPEGEGIQGSNNGNRKRKQKSSPFKISSKDEDSNDSRVNDTPKTKATDDGKSSFGKVKRSPHNAGLAKSSKISKPLDHHSSSSTDHKREDGDYALSTTQVPSINPISLPTKMRSRRKMDLLKSQRDSKIADNILIDQLNVTAHSLDDRPHDLKEQHSNCLSWHKLRRWCVFEWLYSAIDFPWFAKCEFVEYLNHVGLGHIPRLTRVEWGVIRSSLGRPRRFSAQFLKEEKHKLNQYRESVRKHYAELRAGTREGLPTDLARPLSVGQRVIAIHPKTREIHDGSVLTVDYSRCRVQFDRPELGVEFVMDIECMPLNPVENMPANLSRHGVTLDKIFGNLNEVKINGLLKEAKIEDYIKSTSNDKLESTDGSVFISPSTHHINKLIKQAKVDLGCSNLRTKFGLNETVGIQQEASSQLSVLAQIQAKEADVHALSELSRALDKKEVVVSELKRLNDEVLENQINGDNLLKDSENFKKQYAAVLLQLNEVNEQVSSALYSLRQRNTYQGTSPLMFLKPVHDLGDPCSHAQEPGSHVAEIVGSSRAKARTMIDEAMQAILSLKKRESNLENIEEAIDFVSNKLSVDDLALPTVKSTSADTSNATPVSQNHFNAGASNPSAANYVVGSKSNSPSDKPEVEIPSELIAHCVATLLMIQKCTERQFPPADVAQVLDSAVNSLQPCCPQNLPLYAEIQKCMGIIRSQILALIPT